MNFKAALLLLVFSSCILYFTTAKSISSQSLRRLSVPVFDNCYSYDGVAVNNKHPTWGMTSDVIPRLSKPVFTDGIKDPPRMSVSTRVISNAFCKQTTCDATNAFNVSSLLYAYGQFVDHDISFQATGLKFTETLNIDVPAGDVWTTALPFTRAVFASAKPVFANEPVNQVNFVTGFMDCSQVYSSDDKRADHLRAKTGGLLKVDLQYGKEFLPKTVVDPETGLFYLGTVNNSVIAGDTRATESLPISIMQTLFLREHNRLARLIASRYSVSGSR